MNSLLYELKRVRENINDVRFELNVDYLSGVSFPIKEYIDWLEALVDDLDQTISAHLNRTGEERD